MTERELRFLEPSKRLRSTFGNRFLDTITHGPNILMGIPVLAALSALYPAYAGVPALTICVISAILSLRAYHRAAERSNAYAAAGAKHRESLMLTLTAHHRRIEEKIDTILEMLGDKPWNSKS